MRLTVVVAASIRDAVNARTLARDGGETFTAALVQPSEPTVPVAYWTSWDTDAYAGSRWADANGKFDLRDELGGHPWLSGKLRTFAQDGKLTVTRSGQPVARVYRGWENVAVLADLGLVPIPGVD